MTCGPEPPRCHRVKCAALSHRAKKRLFAFSSGRKVYKEPYELDASERGQHAAEDLEAQVLLVTEAIRPALDDTHLVVEPLEMSRIFEEGMLSSNKRLEEANLAMSA